jgi:hypothetical protein
MSAPLFWQWLDFAKEDLAVAQLTFDEKHFSHACFLSQQAIEKALKAFLIAKLSQYLRIHNLTDLLTQYITVEANFTQSQPGIRAVFPAGQHQRHLRINMRRQQLTPPRESCNLSPVLLLLVPLPAHSFSLT